MMMTMIAILKLIDMILLIIEQKRYLMMKITITLQMLKMMIMMMMMMMT